MTGIHVIPLVKLTTAFNTQSTRTISNRVLVQPHPRPTHLASNATDKHDAA